MDQQEGIPHKGKVYKSYDPLASSNNLSIKVTGPTLANKEWFIMHEEIVKESFARGFNFEITGVEKKAVNEFAWIKTTSPRMAATVKSNKVAFANEIFVPNFVSQGKMSEDDKMKKNALILIAKNLSKIESIEKLEEGLKSKIGANNIVSMYFKLENGRHVGTCNVQCLNAAVYKKHVKQNVELHGKYVDFSPHPRSLDGTNPPSVEELKKLGLMDVNSAAMNAVIAMENAPNN